MNKTLTFLGWAIAIALALALVALLVVPAIFYDNDAMSRSAFDGLLVESSPIIYDYQGNVTDTAWLYQEFGDVSWTRTAPDERVDSLFRLISLKGQCDYAALKIDVIDENGDPLSGINIIRYWPGAPMLPDFSDTTASQWTDRGIVGATENGTVGFGMGGGDYYWPDREVGVSAVYIADFDGPSDFLEGLGMVAATNHCHVDSVFQRISVEDPEPTPTPGPSEGEGWDIDLTIKGTIRTP